MSSGDCRIGKGEERKNGKVAMDLYKEKMSVLEKEKGTGRKS